MKLALGTVQFGLDYGISNAAGRVPEAEVQRILVLAAQSGITLLDTAAAYGDAEAVLGRLLPPGHGFRLVTKLPRLPAELDAKAVQEWTVLQFQQSLQRLHMPRAYGLLVHNAQDLLGPQGAALWEVMRGLRAGAQTGKIGVSVYTGLECDALLARFDLDLLQIPINPLDQRLIKGGQLARLKAGGVEVHARSLLLQGLLTMDPATLPAFFTQAVPVLTSYQKACRDHGLTAVDGAVAFARAVSGIDYAVLGVTSTTELRQLINAQAHRLTLDWYAPFAMDNELILNPARWPERV